jgi:DNA-binding response OmpR family regulator
VTTGTTTPAAKIILVEDETIIAFELRVRLSRFGHTVLGVFRRGEDALAATQHGMPDLMLIDIILAGKIDGIETARRVRAAGQTKIIFLTANTDEATRQRAQEIGPEAFLLKPFTEDELRATLAAALRPSPSGGGTT